MYGMPNVVTVMFSTRYSDSQLLYDINYKHLL